MNQLLSKSNQESLRKWFLTIKRWSSLYKSSPKYIHINLWIQFEVMGIMYVKEILMKVRLICSENIKPIVVELLNNRGIAIDETSDIVILEKGWDFIEDTIAMVFDMNSLNRLLELLNCFNTSGTSKTLISGKSEKGYQIIEYEKISYFEGLGNDVFAVCGKSKYKVNEKLYELERDLSSRGFIRVSKSFIVNLMKIDKINPWFNGKLMINMIDSEAEIDVTRKYVKDFKNLLGM